MNTPTETFVAASETAPWAEVGQPAHPRVGDLARAGRSHLYRRRARAARHAARRAGPVAKAHAQDQSRSISTRSNNRRAWSPSTPPADIPGVNDCGPMHPRRPDSRRWPGAVSRPTGLHRDRRQPRPRAPRRARWRRSTTPSRRRSSRREAARQAQSFVLPPMHLTRGDAGASIAARRRIAPRANCMSAGRSSFIWKARSPTRCRKKTDGMLVSCSTQHPSEMQHVVAHVLGWPAHNVACRMPAHGRRLRRQGIAIGSVRVRAALGAAKPAASGQTARRPRRRLA